MQLRREAWERSRKLLRSCGGVTVERVDANHGYAPGTALVDAGHALLPVGGPRCICGSTAVVHKVRLCSSGKTGRCTTGRCPTPPRRWFVGGGAGQGAAVNEQDATYWMRSGAHSTPLCRTERSAWRAASPAHRRTTVRCAHDTQPSACTRPHSSLVMCTQRHRQPSCGHVCGHSRQCDGAA